MKRARSAGPRRQNQRVDDVIPAAAATAGAASASAQSVPVGKLASFESYWEPKIG